MEIDLVSFFERAAQSWWAWAIGIASTFSFYWYYLRHVHKVVVNEEARKPRALLKNFIIGQPLQLLIVLIIVIAIAAIVNYIFNIRLP